ncbi:MAG: 3-deoxy-manno-octulosonate cytidylyltransferase, partial [Planctomycetota bacterium]|nr:3-deoxy-manno-octulosonate cytidylyltransferase [Planctomycetota bacterium]
MAPAVIIIPARYGSQRLPGKPLLRETGRPLLQHVYEAALEAGAVEKVIIATDHEEILEVARGFGADARLTAKDHPSGTDRVAEVARDLPFEIVINLQGDEPEIDPADIDALVGLLVDDDSIRMGTLAHPVQGEDELNDTSVVKVVCDRDGFALYFSRSPIPHPWNEGTEPGLRHIGVYAYRKSTLLELAAASPTPLEQAEGLEQLRALERGIRIRVA